MITRRFIPCLLWAIAATFALAAQPYSPHVMAPDASFTPPSRQHLLGTDRLGRDVLSRTSVGLRRTSLLVLSAECIGALSALLFILMIPDRLLSRLGVHGAADLLTLSIRMVPPLLAALTVSVLLRGSHLALTLSLAIISFAFAVPFIEGEVRTARQLPQQQAATILGAGRLWRLLHYVLPVSGPRLIRYAILDLMALAAYESLFGYFGLSDPNAVSLGGMLADGRPYIASAPWLFAAPTVALIILFGSLWHAGTLVDRRQYHGFARW